MKLRQGNIVRSMCQEFCPRVGGYPSMQCRSPGPLPGEKLRGLTWGVSRPTPGGWYPSMHWGRYSPLPQQTATAGGSTHPTGMHSCVEMFQVRESMNSLDLSICSTSQTHNTEEPCYHLNYVNIQLTRSFLNMSVAA